MCVRVGCHYVPCVCLANVADGEATMPNIRLQRLLGKRARARRRSAHRWHTTQRRKTWRKLQRQMCAGRLTDAGFLRSLKTVRCVGSWLCRN